MTLENSEVEALKNRVAQLTSALEASTNTLTTIYKAVNRKLGPPCPSCGKFTVCLHAGFDCAKIEAWRQIQLEAPVMSANVGISDYNGDNKR